MPILRVQDLVTEVELRNVAVTVVKGVSFSVDAGETLGLVGESGSGKTMTGMSIMGLLPTGGRIRSGSIELDGKELVGSSDKEMGAVRGCEIGMVYQDPMTSLNPTMRIGEQISESVRWHRKATKSAAMDRAVEVLDLVGLPKPRERYNDYPHQLSGGLRQRVMIAMALACEPKLLIADEPTTALDVSIQAQILELLQNLKERLGMAMILITHDMGVVAGRTDRVLVMYGGKIIESAPTTEIFYETRHRYTEALLESIPRLDQTSTERLRSIPGTPPDLRKEIRGCGFFGRCGFSTARCDGEVPTLEGTSSHQWACFHPAQSRSDYRASANPGQTPSANAIFASDASGPDAPQREGVVLRSKPRLIDGVHQDVVAVNGGLGASEEERVHSVAMAREGVADSAPLIELVDVSKDFAVRRSGLISRHTTLLSAVSEVSLSIKKGETFGIVGESGCGKTTLGRMMVALESATSGHIDFEGRDLATLGKGELRHFRRELQMMFQDPYSSLDPRMSVGTIVREPLDIQHLGGRKLRNDRVRELLDEVGLPASSMRRHPHEFSGGQRQRIGLARALALRPKLIVADEPVSALDVSIRSQVLNLMKTLQEQHGVTYVVISHDLSVVRYLADRVGVMYLGRLVEVGTQKHVYESTAHHYTAGLLEAIPLPDPSLEHRKGGVAIKGELPSPLNPPSGCRFRTRCPHAEEICENESPPLRQLERGHFVACHFPLLRNSTLPSTEVATSR